MNPSNACIALALLSTMGANDAFAPGHLPRAMAIPRQQQRQTGQPPLLLREVNTRVYMGSTEEEVAALRAAAQKAREEAQRLAKDLGKEIDMSTTYSKASQAKSSSSASAPPTKEKSLSPSEIQSLLTPINFATSTATEQVTALNTLTTSRSLSLWNIASTSSANTSSPSPLRPYPVSLPFLEQRTGGTITGKSLGVDGEDDVSLDDFKYATIGITLGSSALGIAALVLLPDNTGAALCYGFALLPVLWVAVGSSAPGILAGIIATVQRGGEGDDAKDERVCRHEAAHFLCGYLCGLPVRSYSVGEEGGFPCVEFHPSVDGQVGRELTQEEIAVMSVVAMSGSVAEAMEFDEAKGGGNDLLELSRLFKRSGEFLGATKQQDLTRWGALASYNLLQGNKAAYEKLVTAFKQKKTVVECIAAIESD